MMRSKTKSQKRFMMALTGGVVLLILGTVFFENMWFSPDQRGQRAFNAENYALAAKRFSTPMYRGVAWYRNGDFEEAATAFGRVDSAEGHFNRGNALMMIGNYQDAVDAYDVALLARPDWPDAIKNRKIAQHRADMLEMQEGDRGGMTEIGADEVVFDSTKKNESDSDMSEEDGPEEGMSQSEIQAMWLRKVQTKPADFMRSKFAYQYSVEGEKGPKTEEQP